MIIRAGMSSSDAQLVGAAEVGALPTNEMKQQFSFAFLHMVVSAAGCSIKDHRTDYDGVDVTVASSAEYELYYGPQIEIQLKSTAQSALLTEDAMKWDLSAERFGKLTNSKAYVPRFLAVLLVPDDPALWLEQDETRLVTSSCMYWQRAEELGILPEGQKSRVVRLPRSNILNVMQLQGIMKTIGDGGEW
jgi:hypothetical protein